MNIKSLHTTPSLRKLYTSLLLRWEFIKERFQEKEKEKKLSTEKK